MKRAFTLAEVLITLTIIGVIAAITIPTLMQSWRKHERIVQIKEAYTILSNAVKMSIAENGPVNSWRLSDWNNYQQCAIAKEYIFSYLKIQHICGSNRSFYQKGCFIDNNNGGTWYNLKDELSTNDNGYGADRFCKAKLQNGMDIGVSFTNEITRSNSPNTFPGMHRIVFDVNGKKGPTKTGNDVFVFTLHPETGIVTTSAPWTLENSTKYKDALAQNHGGCNINVIWGNGYACARAIELNGWQIPDDYPIKKF